MSSDRPTFAVTTAADADARRFVDLDTVRALSGIPSTGSGALDDDTLGLRLDAVLASMASSCRLARYRALPPTFAQEEVRATWPAFVVSDYGARGFTRGPQLILPWRTPITAVEITEAGAELEEGVTFRVFGAGVLERIGAEWSLDEIVVDYTAGWIADDDENPPPADLVQAIADQVRLAHAQSSVNPLLRNEDLPGIWSGSFNTIGGDAIDSSGLGRPLLDMLERLGLKAPPAFA
ncbi:hypothetical protein [Reyranella sp.]|uniref:hypothetical protein n=1 Tax=Reyranella sp. TaxID=1929291 RepID=UPI000BD55226|nr:hypothetical protein [Reyranella sp.]OYY35551.1 MAG: hypothetical protein B7Y57_25560 [Rhodospirillales bacterium 35-66-84]OYZ91421.1 MAG: hypothetical protein B7Y08_25430 [Rhodospirillales bacterium 24-66-33]OZB26251.1 MAG: hypothetical protein B7X63_09940 [Rhodospirillales bacterium 39-66-50]HQS15030.1 hypothetical protein [Reyranella sp.]HQT10839.1 hypothetical protein [Reyranella sp.]